MSIIRIREDHSKSSIVLNEIVVYGTKIKTDLRIPFHFPLTQFRYMMDLCVSKRSQEVVKKELTTLITSYSAHGRKVYIYNSRTLKKKPTEKVLWFYKIEGVGAFYWYQNERKVYYFFERETNEHILIFWFIHLFLPLYFTIERMYDIFHGGSVHISGRTVMFSASSMGGKSTLTDYFLQQGHILISDDKIPTYIEGDDMVMVVPSHPYHRPYRSYEELGRESFLYDGRFQRLDAIFILEQGSDYGTSIVIEEVHGVEKFKILFPHYLYAFEFLKKERMLYLTKVIGDVSVFRIHRPWGMHYLEPLYQKIKTTIDAL